MFEKRLTYDDLDITDCELFVQMGYGDNSPTDDIRQEIEAIRDEVRGILRPHFCFIVADGGTVDTVNDTLNVEGRTFSVGRIISRQISSNATGKTLYLAQRGTPFQIGIDANIHF